MGELSYSQRLKTFDENPIPSLDKESLAHAGFFDTRRESEAECFKCHLKISLAHINVKEETPINIHKIQNPNCEFARSLLFRPRRYKSFVNFEGLKYEEERLATFINWPVSWLLPEELARDGFYFLRNKDHCACIFCCEILGAWEEGDTPRGEHKRHSPNCRFIRGLPVGNVSFDHGNILARQSSRHSISLDGNADKDVFGTEKNVAATPLVNTSLLEDAHLIEENGTKDELGLCEHTAPKNATLVTYESRLCTFKDRWPEGIAQIPVDLAEAGFFYIGLSDHVKCFHCGNGLRNWESDDIPWNEHARWYPNCYFVILKKGQDFIDTVCRENPPYIRVPRSGSISPPKVKSSPAAAQAYNVSEDDLSQLMDLDVLQAVVKMGFTLPVVKETFKKKLEQTGQPFFSLDSCIEALIQYMEDVAKTGTQVTAVEAEAINLQASRMDTLMGDNQPSTSANAAVSTEMQLNHVEENVPSNEVVNPSAEDDVTSFPSTSLSIIPLEEAVVATSNFEQSNQSESGNESESSSQSSPSSDNPEESEPIDDEVGEDVPPSRHGRMSSGILFDQDEIRMEEPMEVINGAEELIVVPENILQPVTEESSSDNDSTQESCNVTEEVSSDNNSSLECCNVTEEPKSENLEKECNRLRDSRLCKVCMDAEMDVAFLPCRHMVVCGSCTVALKSCPICREDIKYIIKLIVS